MRGKKARRLRREVYGEDLSPLDRETLKGGTRAWFKGLLKSGKKGEVSIQHFSLFTPDVFLNAGPLRRAYQQAKRQAR